MNASLKHRSSRLRIELKARPILSPIVYDSDDGKVDETYRSVDILEVKVLNMVDLDENSAPMSRVPVEGICSMVILVGIIARGTITPI
ncbi:hypothetical protein KCU93_g107, partial [Aureobasidium melanogenum]